jgi:hypothetical protein
MEWLYGPRYEERHADGSFRSRPVRLNVDDVNEIIGAMETLGMGALRREGAPGAEDPGPWVEVPDLTSAHMAQIRNFRISGESGAEDVNTWIRMSVTFSPEGVVTNGAAPVNEQQRLRSVLNKVA